MASPLPRKAAMAFFGSLTVIKTPSHHTPWRASETATGIEPMTRWVRGGIRCGREKNRLTFGANIRFVINGSIRGTIAETTETRSPSSPSQLTTLLGRTQSSASTLGMQMRTEESSTDRAELLLLPKIEPRKRIATRRLPGLIALDHLLLVAVTTVADRRFELPMMVNSGDRSRSGRPGAPGRSRHPVELPLTNAAIRAR